MLLPVILSYASLLLPLTMADFGITVLVPDQWKDIAVVNGMNSSSGVPLDMTRESADPGSMGLGFYPCLSGLDCSESGNSLNYGVAKSNSLNYGVAKIDFSSPTTNPRPISITLPNYTLQVSIKYVSC
jgi:hypothetical protein